MDLLQRGINADRDIRVVTAVTTELVREACERHELRPPEAVVLGRALTAGCLLATLTKSDDERVRIQMNADGPLGRLLVDARGNGWVRGCFTDRPEALTDPIVANGRADVGRYVGHAGKMVITRDIGLEREYQGVIDVHEGQVDLEVERYLGRSEQLPSAMACEVVLDARGTVLRAAGVLCQTFPESDTAPLDAIRDNLHSEAFAVLLAQERSPEDLMGFALLGGTYKAMRGLPLSFHCGCDLERALSVVSTLGADDIEQLATEQEETHVKCTYCGLAYTLGREDLLDLARRLRQERS